MTDPRVRDPSDASPMDRVVRGLVRKTEQGKAHWTEGADASRIILHLGGGRGVQIEQVRNEWGPHGPSGHVLAYRVRVLGPKEERPAVKTYEARNAAEGRFPSEEFRALDELFGSVVEGEGIPAVEAVLRELGA